MSSLMFLFMGINCSLWHRWPWSHCPCHWMEGWVIHPDGHKAYFIVFSHSPSHAALPSALVCFLQISHQPQRWCPCAFPRKSTHTFCDMKLSCTKVKIWVWERPCPEKFLWLSSCCIFCRIGNILKPISSVAYIQYPPHHLIPLCFILPSPPIQSLNLHSCFSQFLWWHHWVHSSFMENELSEVL